MADTQEQQAGKPAKHAASRRPARSPPRRRRAREPYVARLKTQFDQNIRAELTKQFGYTNPMQVPVITKMVLNMGIGEGVADRKKVERAAADLSLIAGQKAVITKARKSIATYKLRDGQAIGCKVTLRKARMYEFLDRLINIALPRIRDFRGLNPKSFDGRGNYSWASRSTSCSRRSTTTRPPTSGAWTSRSAPRARPTTRRARCSTAFNFPFRQ